MRPSRPRPIGLCAFALVLGFLAAPPARAQSFTKITSGDPVVSAGGHRGAGWVDADGDGDLDLFVTRGAVVGDDDELYRNDGGGSFASLPASAPALDGLRDDGESWGDYDGDGDEDLFVVSWYGEVNALFRNDGACAFTRITAGPAVNTGTFSEDCAWVDYDADGDLDLFVASSGTAGEVNRLYRNDGGGTLTPITTGPLVTDVRKSRHGAWADWDGDGDVDVFVVNEDNLGNQLYKNLLVETGSPDFVSVAAGDATSDLGMTSFSASWGDFDNDGDLDLIVANFNAQNDALYRNELVETGTPTLTKLATEAPSTSFGWTVSTLWGDFDNDGDLDLFMTNGYSTTPGQTRRNFVFRNDGGTFVRDFASPPAVDQGWSYGASFGDYDGDGDLDLFVANWLDENQTNYLYRNEAQASGNHWLEVRCVGTASNRSGIGATIRATAVLGGTSVTQTRVVAGSDGYCSHNLIQHFGLADAATVDLVVRWPSGALQALDGVAANQKITIVEASSVDAPALGGAPRHSLLREARPNPFRAGTVLGFDLPVASLARLAVFDAAGRCVRTLAQEPRPAGAHEVLWDGRDATGRVVGPGVYFYRLEAVGRSETGKVTRVR
ncbi:MAG: FG-GAP-like repeat-containing protein [bacterium]